LNSALRKFLGEHDHRLSQFQFDMPKPPVRLGKPHDFLRAEDLFVKLDRIRRVANDQVGKQLANFIFIVGH